MGVVWEGVGRVGSCCFKVVRGEENERGERDGEARSGESTS